jgi:histidine ammonia-lyase/tyrosine ammonia-lyase
MSIAPTPSNADPFFEHAQARVSTSCDQPIDWISPAAPSAAAKVVRLGPDFHLSPEIIEEFVRSDAARVEFSAEAYLAMDRSRLALERAREQGTEIYGLTTGFGPHVRFPAAACADEQGAGLIAHLGAGFGPPARESVVLATMLIRAQTIAKGMSGIAPAAAQGLLALLNARVTPCIPEVGSVGASGDLIPLSFIARLLMGEGEATCRGTTLSAKVALETAGLQPLKLSGRDALALVNGTSFMSAYAALAVVRAQRLIEVAEQMTGWLYRVLGCRSQALDPRLHAARGHSGQISSAAAIRREAARFGEWEDTSRPLQEVYSLRCAPQFFGACRDQISHARALISQEINGVNDNPLVWTGPDGEAAVIHGGNFQGQQIAFACDVINSAVVQAAVVAERQLDVMVNPDLTGGAPLLLAWQPGATSGMAGAQITATALIAEMRHHGGPVATSSIPTNGRNQDVVSMGTLAARAALEQSDRLGAVLAILGMAADQLTYLREHGKAQGKITPRAAWMPEFKPFRSDRPLHADIRRIAQEFCEG